MSDHVARTAATSTPAPSALSDAFVFATIDAQLLEARYHVPRSQVYPGSRGRQHGHVHLHAKVPINVGRIHRQPGQALCGRLGWWERPLEELEIATPCPRCADVERRRRNAE